MIYDFQNATGDAAYFALIQMVIPRPIAWVLTANSDATFNLAPFSFFNAVCGHPPILAIGVARREGLPKDTWRNIAERPDYVIHIPPRDLAQQVVQTAANLPPGESELVSAQLQTVAVKGWPLPRVVDTPVAFLCRRERILEIGLDGTALILGEVTSAWVDDRVVARNDERLIIDAQKINPLTRLGGNQYAGLGDIFSIKRPN